MEAFNFFEVGFVLIGSLFIAILWYLIKGSNSIQSSRKRINNLTILIAIKNEALRLPDLVLELHNSLIGHPEVKVHILNDHSTDMSNQLISDLNLGNQISLRNASEKVFGKKAVLNEAINEVSSSWILFMDADTELPENFFDVLEEPRSDAEKCILIPLSPKKRDGIVSAFFDLDFLSLHFAGLKSASRAKPLLANGACMLINRQAYLESMVLRDDWNQPSGDDVFAMFAIAKKYGPMSVSASANVNNPVLVSFPSDFKTLWHQRLRWVGKTGGIKDSWFKLVSFTVLIMQIFLVGMAVFIAQNAISLLAIVSLFLVIISEIFFLALAAKNSNRKDLWIYIVPSVFIYPFYLLTLGIFSIFAKPKWK